MRAALRERPDRVHCGSLAETGIVGLGLKLLLRIPLLVHVHGTELWAHRAGPVAQVVRQVLRRADRVVAPSEFTRSRVLAMGVHPTRCEVVLPPVDVRRFPLSDSPIEPRMVVSVGRLVDYKGHDVVLRGVQLFLGGMRHLGFRQRLFAIGHARAGALAQVLHHLSSDIGHRQNSVLPR